MKNSRPLEFYSSGRLLFWVFLLFGGRGSAAVMLNLLCIPG